MRLVALSICLLLAGGSLASNPSPYAGEESRRLKSLSDSEIDALRLGEGMGFAKLAELNHYPGPRHVLDVADELSLTPSQRFETEKLFEEMRASAISLGRQLIAVETALERVFEQAAVEPVPLQRSLLEIGRIRAELRYVHLEAHLRQRALLTPQQIRRYDELRGYSNAAGDHHQHAKGHHADED